MSAPSGSSFDVVVAGAGLAGATAAVALAQAGLRVAAVDPQRPGEGPVDARASAVSYAPFRLWRALGIADRLAANAQPITGIVVSEGRPAGAAPALASPAWIGFDLEDLGRADAGEPLGWMVENRHARQALAGALEEAGVVLHAPATVTAAVPDAAGVSVQLSTGAALRAALVVAADGRDSALRRAAGIDVVGWPYRQAALAATVAHERPHDGVARQVFLPNGPLAVLPLAGDRSSLVWIETPEGAAALERLPPEGFLSLLRRRMGDSLGDLRLEGPRWSHPLALQVAETRIAPRLALLGDAACAIHPLAGQGLNLGLKDSAALAEAVTDAFRLGEDLGSTAVLDRYARRRRFDAGALGAGTDLLGRLYADREPAVMGVRGLGVTLANRSAPLRRFFAREAGGALGDLPRLLRGAR